MILKILLPAKMIPIGSKVTKRNGDKKYIIQNQIKIYHLGKTQEITSENGSRLLISDLDIHAIDENTEIIWITESITFSQFLENEER